MHMPLFWENSPLVLATVLPRFYFSSFFHYVFSFPIVISYLALLTRMRIRILAKIFCFSWLPFGFDSTFIHSFIVFCLFNSSFPRFACSDTDANAHLDEKFMLLLASFCFAL
jgi:hypothetical protein